MIVVMSLSTVCKSPDKVRSSIKPILTDECSRFITVTIIITALLRHSAYVIVDGKVIKMERLNESQLRVQAARLFEENYNYSVIAKETKSQ